MAPTWANPADVGRRGLLELGLVAAAVTILSDRAEGKTRRNAMMISNENFPCGRTDEGHISSSDHSLPPRVRALIAIGEDGIARQNDAALNSFFHPDYRFHGPGGAELDRLGLWDYFARCRAAFDDFTVTRQAVVSDGGDYIACRTRFAGRFTRPFDVTPAERIEPNGRPFEYRLINIFRYAPDGRLAEEWAQYDVGAFMAQLRRSADKGA